MKVALKDKRPSFMHRCPDCQEYITGMTVTHPWRLWCDRCSQELANPDHPEYYPEEWSRK